MSARRIDAATLIETIEVHVEGKVVAVLERSTHRRGMFPYKAYLLDESTTRHEFVGEFYMLDDALEAIYTALYGKEDDR